jgi:hypothetical protein
MVALLGVVKTKTVEVIGYWVAKQSKPGICSAATDC